MRNTVIELARESGIEVVDNQSLAPHDIENATELFLTNATNGIRWVIAYKNFRFYNHLSKSLISLLNKKTELNN